MRTLISAALLIVLTIPVAAGEVNGPPAPAPTPPSGTSGTSTTTYQVLVEAILTLIKK